MLSSEWADVFDDPLIQVGPIHLLFNGLVDLIAEVVRIDQQVLLSVIVQLAYVLGMILMSRVLLDLHDLRYRAWVEVLIAAVAVGFTLPWTAFFIGHAAEGFIPLLWIIAGARALRGRTWSAAVLIGLAGGWKLWGILGLPLLFLARPWQSAWRGVPLAVGVLGLLYAPFFAFGTVRTFGYAWKVSSASTLVNLLVAPGETFGWELRAIQAALVVLVGSMAVMLAHARGALWTGIWAVPAAMAGARLLLDPFAHFYQWLPFQTAALVGVMVVLSGGGGHVRVVVPLTASVLFLTLPAAALSFAAIAFGIGALWIARWVTEDPVLPRGTTAV